MTCEAVPTHLLDSNGITFLPPSPPFFLLAYKQKRSVRFCQSGLKSVFLWIDNPALTRREGIIPSEIDVSRATLSIYYSIEAKICERFRVTLFRCFRSLRLYVITDPAT
ncbi:hypothetical protein CEXT_33931 [Caerostris extrusa]|uniref:Uncharacterized protein n=1 Tax=Caerostris extrusa TaxID=172846 RepID=A0AAV4N409_CAEEX|nr:hypothetical protein CEXT_33931 [Caerostris extrusa]